MRNTNTLPTTTVTTTTVTTTKTTTVPPKKEQQQDSNLKVVKEEEGGNDEENNSDDKHDHHPAVDEPHKLIFTRNLKNATQNYKHRVTEIQKDGKIRKNELKTKKSNAPTLHISVSSQFPAPPQSCEANQGRGIFYKKSS